MKKNISRKEFIKIGSAAAMSIPILGLTNCNASDKKKNEDQAEDQTPEYPSKYADHLGIQLYTVRDAMASDPQSTLEKVARVGYKELEAYDILSLPKIRSIAEDLGMKIIACHTPVGFLTGTWENPADRNAFPPDYSIDHVIEAVAGQGITNVGIAYLYAADRQTLDDYKNIAGLLNAAGEKARAAGCHLYYHNHSFEFEPMQGTTPWDTMMQILDPNLVHIELDVFWSQIAHVDPVEVIRKLNGRVKFLHLKDLKPNTPRDYATSGVNPEVFLPVGEGIVDIKGILVAAHETGVEYGFVEQDHAPNRDIFECIDISYKHLVGLNM
jgi:sugar phosphate isomerase/epimerase